jgi:hypothetical protein
MQLVKLRRQIAFGIVGLLMLSAVAGFGYDKWKFPYGHSHCCIKSMMFALHQYADEHEGRFPFGQQTPEASLSLLFKGQYVDSYVLRGMTIPQHRVEQILTNGGLLGPDTCGWNYVDGLTRADNDGLAILWCKQPLGHNGQRNSTGAREVLFVGDDIKWISGVEWPSFVAEQKKLLAQRSDRERGGVPLVSAEIRLPNSTIVTNQIGPYTLTEQTEGVDRTGSGSSSGSGMSPHDLKWWKPPIQSGSVTRTLSFDALTSELVTVNFKNGVPDRTNVVFQMKK